MQRTRSDGVDFQIKSKKQKPAEKREDFSVFKVIVLPVLIIMLLIVLDQVIKGIFHYKYRDTITVIKNFFYLEYLENSGAAFGLFGNKPWAQTFFKVLTGVAVLLFFAIFYFIPAKKRFLKWTMVLIIAGTLGNFIDRLAFSYVVDFFKFQFGNYYFPTFNIADIYLTVGVIMVIIDILIIEWIVPYCKKKKAKE